ncbi:MAG: hypothetical protein M3R38_11450 [Actinomycetota bacterium]|nr:hypothetical protein [Actinomycetota bacterium]
MTLPVTQEWYTAAVSLRHIYFFALAVLVATFVALYPYLGAMGMCHSGECPYATQSSTQSSATSAGVAGLCLGAVLAVSPAGILAFATLRGRRLSEERLRPEQFFLSPDPPPPQFSVSR